MRRGSEDPKDRADESVARLLDRMPLEDPPEDLKANVLRAIGARPGPVREDWLESLRAGLKRRLFVQLYPFAAGAAVGVIAFALLTNVAGTRGNGAGSMAGAMVPSSSRPAGSVVDDQSYELNRANVRLQVVRARGRVVASVMAETSDEVAITLQYPRGRLRMTRLDQAAPGSGAAGYGPGWVRVRLDADGRTDLVFEESGAGDAPIQVGITSGSATVQGVLHTTAAAP